MSGGLAQGMRGLSAASLGEFIPAGSGGLNNPRVILFRPNGEVFVTSEGSNRVLVFDEDGGFIRELVTYQRPTGMAISPYDGKLHVTSAVADRVWRFDLRTETKEGTLVGHELADEARRSSLEFRPFGVGRSGSGLRPFAGTL